jgi:hypothetical protein
MQPDPLVGRCISGGGLAVDDIRDPAFARASLIERVKAILLRPSDTWAIIDVEPTSISALYSRYVLILAAIGPVCAMIGSLLFGYGLFGIVYRPSITSALSTVVVTYGLSLVMVYVLALIIDALAPTFNGTKNREQAFKVAAYASTASWVGGVFGLLPQLAILASLAGLYSLYLLYLGLPRLMKVAQDKAFAYVACVVLAAIVLFLVLGAITGAVTSRLVAFPGTAAAAETTSGSVAVPGVGAIDLGKLEAASKQMAAAAAASQAPAGSPAADGAVAAVAPSVLQNLLPGSLPGLARTAISASSAGAVGFNGSTAEARYGADGKGIKLSITDLGAAGALAALGSAFNVQSSTEDADGYEKIGMVDDRMTTEKWSAASKSGNYSVLVANRFMIAAEGDGLAMSDIKAALASVDAASLERLPK